MGIGIMGDGHYGMVGIMRNRGFMEGGHHGGCGHYGGCRHYGIVGIMKNRDIIKGGHRGGVGIMGVGIMRQWALWGWAS